MVFKVKNLALFTLSLRFDFLEILPIFKGFLYSTLGEELIMYVSGLSCFTGTGASKGSE
jgi:hypothetical protein